MAVRWLRGATALLMVAAVAVPPMVGRATARRAETASDGASNPDRLRPAVLTVCGLATALAAAALGKYPFGSTRHSAWLLVCTLPSLGWVVAWALARSRRQAARAAAGLVLLAVVSGPLGRGLGEPRAPWSPTERVLRQASLMQVVDLLDPLGSPRLLVMSAQTFYLLLPFYPGEREAATGSEDGTLFHFALGERRVLVSEAWDFTAGIRPAEASGLPTTDLVLTLARAAEAFPDLGLDEADQAVLIIGGWRPPVVDAIVDLSQEAGRSFLAGVRSVPGLYAFLLDLPALREALGA